MTDMPNSFPPLTLVSADALAEKWNVVARKQRNAKTKVFVETPDGLEGPTLLGEYSYKEIFLANTNATALWILPPDMREPYRVPFRRPFFANAKPSRAKKTRVRKPKTDVQT